MDQQRSPTPTSSHTVIAAPSEPEDSLSLYPSLESKGTTPCSETNASNDIAPCAQDVVVMKEDEAMACGDSEKNASRSYVSKPDDSHCSGHVDLGRDDQAQHHNNTNEARLTRLYGDGATPRSNIIVGTNVEKSNTECTKPFTTLCATSGEMNIQGASSHNTNEFEENVIAGLLGEDKDSGINVELFSGGLREKRIALINLRREFGSANTETPPDAGSEISGPVVDPCTHLTSKPHTVDAKNSPSNSLLSCFGSDAQQKIVRSSSDPNSIDFDSEETSSSYESSGGDDEYIPMELEDDLSTDEEYAVPVESEEVITARVKPSDTDKTRKKVRKSKRKIISSPNDESDILRHEQSSGTDEATTKTRKKVYDFSKLDDSNDVVFHDRLSMHYEPENFKEISDSLKVSREVWNRLFKYQKQGVVWLSELHEQYVGGILADEMGLGKTIQVIAFLRAIDESQKTDKYMNFKGLGPSLIVCPSTILRQWVEEFHKWMPRCRVAILHSTGNHKGPKRGLIRKMVVNRKGGSVIITTYATFLRYKDLLLPERWHYVILDEGHKIRNPKAQITIAVKQLHTPCRLILSGTPLQNSLTEIWSLMDFVYAGKLNSLDTFIEKFSLPITQGGYANATKQQLTAAYKCAVVLRDAISPFILRRMKKNVNKSLDLPDKNEKVLFCEVTSEQRRLYLDYLNSRECHCIFEGRLDAFVGLTTLRKLCNHPDLVSGGPNRHHDFDENEDPTMTFGYYDRSGKMRVLLQLLELWKKEAEQKVLVFSQSREMLSIIERKMQDDGYTYLRMDGSTNIAKRQKIVREFNENPKIFLFLLTTRVGGLGINLTAANKVVIFDPDWNPCTDTQAKERAYRIGQERPVTIYRLLCAGTIEEKVYHRQIFKQFLANRVLKDPRQRQFFKTNDLHDLFSFADVKKDYPTETGAIFASETGEIRKDNFFDSGAQRKEKKRKAKKRRKDADADENTSVDRPLCELSETKKAELRERARALARKLSDLQSGKRSKANEGQGGHEEFEADRIAEFSSGKKKREASSLVETNENEYQRQTVEDLLPESSLNQCPTRHEEAPKLSKSHQNLSRNLPDKPLENSEPSRSRKSKITITESSCKRTIQNSDDDYVLGCLLKSAGVRCAMQHDDLVGEKPSDYLVEKEAEAVARVAANAICKRSNMSFVREFRSKFSKPSDRKTDAISKPTLVPFQGKKRQESLLAAIHSRKQKEDESAAPSFKVKDKNVAIAQKIRDFMVKSGGRAFTENIYKAFKSDFEHDMVQFRATLRKLCDLDFLKREWFLKDEYW